VKGQLNTARRNIEKLNEDIAELKSQKDIIEKIYGIHIGELDGQISTLGLQNEALLARTDELEKQLALKQSEIDELRAKYEAEVAGNIHIKEDIEKLERELSSLDSSSTKELERLSATLEEKEKELEVSRNAKDDLLKLVKKLKEELDDEGRRKLDELHAKIVVSREETDRMRERVREDKNQLFVDKAKDILEEIERNNVNFRNFMGELRKKILIFSQHLTRIKVSLENTFKSREDISENKVKEFVNNNENNIKNYYETFEKAVKDFVEIYSKPFNLNIEDFFIKTHEIKFPGEKLSFWFGKAPKSLFRQLITKLKNNNKNDRFGASEIIHDIEKEYENFERYGGGISTAMEGEHFHLEVFKTFIVKFKDIYQNIEDGKFNFFHIIDRFKDNNIKDTDLRQLERLTISALYNLSFITKLLNKYLGEIDSRKLSDENYESTGGILTYIEISANTMEELFERIKDYKLPGHEHS
jgi:IS1 family transposase